MTKQITTTSALLTLIMLIFGNLVLPLPARAETPPVLITEVQTGLYDIAGIEYPRAEFIELSNVSGDPVNMTGWKLEYLSAANTGITPGLTIDTISGQIGVNGHGIWEHEQYYPVPPDVIFGFGDTSSTGYLAKSGGHIRLMNGSIVVDCVAWGSAVAIEGCDKVNSAPAAGYTIQRKPTNGTYDRSTGVVNLSPSTPRGGDMYATTVTPPVSPPSEPVVLVPQKECVNVQLSEILANPAGDDASGEFIELYNPNDQPQSLYGCSLKLGNSKQYEFPIDAIPLAPHEYRAFMYELTNLQLSNSGTTVSLFTTGEETRVTYLAVADDEAWALIGNAWQSTMQPTPNSANKIGVSKIEAVAAAETAETEPCPVGKFRNPETGRCKNVMESATLTVCNADQERNPDTGRCRKKTVANSVSSCPTGQERNLVTNRCRKIELASTSKACEPGQERNPETGRCRKVTNKSSGKVLGETVGKKTYHYFVVAGFLLVILGYGAYEYRHELASFVSKCKKRLFVR